MVNMELKILLLKLIECSRKIKLNEKKNYWQDYFKAKEFGYSIK